MTVTLSKNSLKQQQDQLALYRKFLPSLDLKRQQLLGALKSTQAALARLEEEHAAWQSQAADIYPLLGGDTLSIRDLSQRLQVQRVELRTENLAGVRLPLLAAVEVEASPGSTLATPFWVDRFVELLKQGAQLRMQLSVQRQRIERLEGAVRRVTQRVNLFDKVLIPQAQQTIKRIQIFLADQERSAVVRSKIAKSRSH